MILELDDFKTKFVTASPDDRRSLLRFFVGQCLTLELAEAVNHALEDNDVIEFMAHLETLFDQRPSNAGVDSC